MRVAPTLTPRKDRAGPWLPAAVAGPAKAQSLRGDGRPSARHGRHPARRYGGHPAQHRGRPPARRQVTGRGIRSASASPPALSTRPPRRGHSGGAAGWRRPVPDMQAGWPAACPENW